MPPGYEGDYSLGLHPWYLPEDIDQALAALAVEAKGSSVRLRALGEAGLDRLCASPWSAQLAAFEGQIRLAQALDKPLVIHCVKAWNEVLASLKSCGYQGRLLFHGYRQKAALTAQILRAQPQAYFSLGAYLPQAAERLNHLPLERCLLETDEAPSDSLPSLYVAWAASRGLSLEQAQAQIEVNVQAFLGD